MDLGTCGSCGLRVLAQETAAPFVAGFERFGRHDELDGTLGGRLLLTELSCTACHAAPREDLRPKRGPRLNGVGLQLRSAWLRQFLAAPHQTKPGTTMPDLLSGMDASGRQRAVTALTAFLATQREPFPTVKASGASPVPFAFWDKGDASRGGLIYHQVGCVACHEPDPARETAETRPSPLDQLLQELDAEELAEMGLASAARRVSSVPHPDLPAKYTRQALTFFLLDPERTRPAGRMPNLKLTPMEAADLAAYLLDRLPQADPTDVEGVGKPPEKDPIEKDPAEKYPESASDQDASLVQEGRRLFGSLGCVHCHSASGLETRTTDAAQPLERLDVAAESGCLGRPGPGIPRYGLDAAQRAAVRQALTELPPAGSLPAGSLPAAERLQGLLLQANCLACHERNGLGGVGRFRRPHFETVGNVDLGDEGRLPPPLTAAGRKLQTAWFAKVLQGNGDIRPYLRVRMPRYPQSLVAALPGLFAGTDPPADEPSWHPESFGSPRQLVADGRRLLDTGCVQCHPLRGVALPGVVGVDLDGIAQRVRPQWFPEFLRDPGRLKARTRMPTFFPNGRSQNQEVLAGDAPRQIAAIWAYLKDLPRQPLPDKIERARSEDYELAPKDRPLLLRTFLKDVGTRAIAVGFPQGVHFAFDAETPRLALAWRGRFLDAQGTWFIRFAPYAEPLGEALVPFPPGPCLAKLEDPQQAWPEGPQDVQAGEAGSERDGAAGDGAPPGHARVGGKPGYRGFRLDSRGVPTFLYRLDEYLVEDTIEPHESGGLLRRLRIREARTGEAADAGEPSNRAAPRAAGRLWFRAARGTELRRTGPNECTGAAARITAARITAALVQSKDSSSAAAGTEASQPLGILRGTSEETEWRIPLDVQQPVEIEVRYRW